MNLHARIENALGWKPGEAMRVVIQRLCEFEPYCAEDLREEFLPDARWDCANANGVPLCDARLVLPES